MNTYNIHINLPPEAVSLAAAPVTVSAPDLALTAELVNLHGGSVTAESAAGEGSTFLVSIPFGAGHLPPAMTVTPETGARPVATPHAYLEEALPWMPEEPQNLSGGTENIRREGRLLLADDNADMRGYVRRVLADHYEIEAVTNGSEALDAAHRSLPDLILSDVMMPKRNGLELVVEDDGIGMIPDAPAQGGGLGRKIVGMMGTKLQAEISQDQAHKGVRTIIRIPPAQ